MCIRDSNFKVQAEALFEGGVDYFLIETAQDTRNIKAALIAVSYTHLRAHETVLDLVCRLLLEKKK